MKDLIIAKILKLLKERGRIRKEDILSCDKNVHYIKSIYVIDSIVIITLTKEITSEMFKSKIIKIEVKNISLIDELKEDELEELKEFIIGEYEKQLEADRIKEKDAVLEYLKI